MSEFGTFRTSPDVRLESAFGGRADVICSERVFPVLTRTGHRRSPKYHAFKAAFLPIQALTQTVTMPSPEFGDGYAASRFHHDYRRRGSGVAAQGPRAAAGADGKDRSDVGIQCERSRSKAVRRSA